MSFDLDLANPPRSGHGWNEGNRSRPSLRLSAAPEHRVVATSRSVPDQPAQGVRYSRRRSFRLPKAASAVAHSVLKQLGGIDILVNVFGGSSAPGGGIHSARRHGVVEGAETRT